MLVEVKKPKLKDGKEQLRSYCHATGAPIAIWTNGDQISYYQRKDPNYFEEIIKTYLVYPNALGVGGYINNEAEWEKVAENYNPTIKEFAFDGWKQKEHSALVACESCRYPQCEGG